MPRSFQQAGAFSLGFEPHLETEVVRAFFKNVPMIILQGKEKLEIADGAHPAIAMYLSGIVRKSPRR
jgi:hypothetical protein